MYYLLRPEIFSNSRTQSTGNNHVVSGNVHAEAPALAPAAMEREDKQRKLLAVVAQAAAAIEQAGIRLTAADWGDIEKIEGLIAASVFSLRVSSREAITVETTRQMIQLLQTLHFHRRDCEAIARDALDARDYWVFKNDAQQQRYSAIDVAARQRLDSWPEAETGQHLAASDQHNERQELGLGIAAGHLAGALTLAEYGPADLPILHQVLNELWVLELRRLVANKQPLLEDEANLLRTLLRRRNFSKPQLGEMRRLAQQGVETWTEPGTSEASAYLILRAAIDARL